MLIEVSPHIRIPRTFKRFAGLMVRGPPARITHVWAHAVYRCAAGVGVRACALLVLMHARMGVCTGAASAQAQNPSSQRVRHAAQGRQEDIMSILLTNDSLGHIRNFW